MKKSVNLYFKLDGKEREKILEIKKAGFDEFFTGVNDDGSDMSFKQQCEFANSIGLKCTMIHCKYNPKTLHCFWENSEKGKQLCNNFINQIKECSGLTNNFVIHLNGRKSQKQSKIGLERIHKLLKVCDKCKLNLCIENLNSRTEIPYIFKNIHHKRLKICFDIGHKNFLTPNWDLFNEYYKHIEVLHLHDNHGGCDEHLICGKGNIDWNKFANDIKKLPNIVLASEVKIKNTEEKTRKALKCIYKSVKKLDKKIKKVRV